MRLAHSMLKKRKRGFASVLDDDEMFGVQARLGPRIMSLDEISGKLKPKPSDYELWLECRNRGTIYTKQDTKVEAMIVALVQTKTNPFDKGKTPGVGQRKKGKRGRNSRLKATEDYIKDEDLKRELNDGAQW